MTNANAEAQRRWRQRQKEKKQAELTQAPTGVGDLLQTPFYQFKAVQRPYDASYEFAARMAGNKDPMMFRVDGGYDPDDDDDEDPHYGLNGSYRLAAETVGHLIMAAKALSSDLNEYLGAELKMRVAELEASDLSDPDAKKAALQHAARLNKMLDQLDKQVRITFPQWKVGA